MRLKIIKRVVKLLNEEDIDEARSSQCVSLLIEEVRLCLFCITLYSLIL
jgi:hypothetical protein